MVTTQQNEPRNGGQAQSGGSAGQQGGNESQSAAVKAADLAANLATKQVKKTRERIDDQISQQRQQITGRVRTLSRALRGAGDVLEEDDVVSQALRYASDKVETAAGYVEELSPTRLADDLRGIASSKPLWFFGGAFALGLGLGRFARSSGESATGDGGMSGSSASRGTSSTMSRSTTRTGELAGRSAGSEAGRSAGGPGQTKRGEP